MASIKPLPEAVRSSVRSGIILFDLTRVVEELVFNSLDAGASKVSIFVGIGTNYVKVVDDGFGISRDGLVSLGERYVTSKLKQPIDSGGGSFGFRGEALASISDVALLEIVTKAQGKPNGYRKVIKGSKCLYLGIDDDRREVGTTVVVRDLFYNQPVRRKHIQASPKKILLSVKQCVLRIALVHPSISFNIIDIESEDELLCTKPSSSPLSLLMAGFGIEDVSSFHKVNSEDGLMKLSGYICGPCDNVATKIFQYVYINSRFVCSGPIHKLLNNLAASFECLDPSKVNRYQKGKRVRFQGYPAYILNIRCPPASYDFTFEPSKTHIEFKDWECILAFVEKTIQPIWNNTLSHANQIGKDETLEEYGNISSVIKDVDDGVSLGNKFIIKKCKTQNHQPTFDLPITHDQIPSELYKNTKRFEEVDCSFRSWNTEQLEEAGCSFQSWERPLAKCADSVTKNSDDLSGISDDNLLPGDDYLVNRFAISAGSKRQAESMSISSKLGYEFSSEWLFRENSRKPFLKACSTRESLPFDEYLFESKIGVESPICSFRTKRKRIGSGDEFSIMEVDLTDQIFDCFSKNRRQDEALYCQTPPRHEITDELPSGFNPLTRTSPLRFHSYGDSYSEDYSFLSYSDMQVENSSFRSFNSEWCSVSPDPFKHFPSKTLEGRFRSHERDHSRHSLGIEEKKSMSSFDGMSSPVRENLTFGIENAEVEFNGHNDVTMDFCSFIQDYNKDDKFSKGWSDFQFERKNYSSSGLRSKDYSSINEYESPRNQFRYQDSKQNTVPGGRLRSKSAPPFCRRKSRFISLSNCLQKVAEAANRSNLVEDRDGFSPPDTGKLKHSQPSPVLSLKKHFDEDSENINDVPKTISNAKAIKKDENFKQSRHMEALENVSVRDIVSNPLQDSVSSATKWRVGFAQMTNNESSDIQNKDSILDISSGFPHIAIGSLVPESINKSCLENAKILQQVDRKFIPIVAGGTLAVIDQHAADERIRLEDLRQKVLSGEAKTVTYLDSEQELIMPEIGFQLLHNYAEQIKCWGWICNIHAEDSRSFKKNLTLLHQQPAVITLIAVPCILGVNLSDVDLLEFLQQLADTDGSSTMPPSVNRILNSKACRGAIMFGDSLLHSECSLIVQELKQTSLCFQCAHGRPTTVPLLNLEELHKQIAKLEAMSSSPSKSWHGLCRHEFSIQRASKRLSSGC